MEITDMRIKLTKNQEKEVKAIVSTVFDDVFVINEMKIIEKSDGSLILSMPSKKDFYTGEYWNTSHPIDNNFRLYLEEKIFGAYKELIKEEENGNY